MNNHDHIIKYVCVGPTGRIKVIKLDKYPRIYEYLLNRFSDSESIKETINRIYYNILIRPVCPVCGGKLKYIGYKNRLFREHCSSRCSAIDTEVRKKTENTCIEKYGCRHNWTGKMREQLKQKWVDTYGADNPFAFDLVKESIKKTCIEKYGTEYYSLSEDYRCKVKSTWDNKTESQIQSISRKRKQTITCIDNYYKQKQQKAEETNLLRYNKKYYTQTALYKDKIHSESELINEKRKHTCLVKYNAEFYNQTEEFKSKRISALKLHNSFNKSKPAELLYNILIELYGIDDIIREYKEVRYPYNCDFYIKSEDLFIELQGHMTHGGHPYNIVNDIDELNRLLQLSDSKNLYHKKLIVWTIKDVNKRNTAKVNNLKYLEIFNINFDKETILNKIKEYLLIWQSK